MALIAIVTGAASASVSAAIVEAAKSAIALPKMPTMGQERVGTRSPGSGSA
ncbi:hypothetical protein [Rhodococcus qingshengii]|uniref:hypothetical protein n=1 Tax=Rhodococcus qingshengii TaxID=334542 RepID=UPI0022B5887C|nr:hypothetical protein [Rhodococcus qingshengii]MCZ4618432.1 hypothetical protein [Rhodococcus qingshengii]